MPWRAPRPPRTHGASFVTTTLSLLSRAVLVLAIGATNVVGQCANVWRPADVLPGADGDVLAAVRWDPDGAGPLGEHVVFGGAFQWIGGLAANRVVLHDPATNTSAPLGSGLDGTVQTLLVLATGELIAGGSFATSGGVAVANVARWTGSAWAPIGAGLSQSVFDFVVMPNGDLVAAGSQNVQRWNGSTWTTMGPASFSSVATLAVLQNGDLIAGGYFPDIGGVFYDHLARWTGSAWVPFGGGATSRVDELLTMPNGDLIAGGQFQPIGSVVAPYLARWNGTTWLAMNSPVQSQVHALALHANGTLLVGGSGGAFGGVAQWNGVAWSPVLVGLPAPTQARAIVGLPSGDLFVGGTFTMVGATSARNVVRATPTAWLPIVAGGPSLGVLALSLAPNGDLVASGNFQFPGLGLRQIARRSGGVWSPIGSVLTGNQFVHALPNGDVVAGHATALQRWDGSAWNAFGPAPPVPGIGGYNVVVGAPNGDVLVGGNFVMGGPGGPPASVARWDGATWSIVGGFLGTVDRLAVAADGSIVAAGSLHAGGNQHELARFDGTQWSTWDLAAGPHVMSAVLALPDGSVVVSAAPVPFGGANASTVSRWNGGTWTPFGGAFTGLATGLLRLPDGDLVASGGFTAAGGVPARGLARWNGVAWQPLAGGVGSGVNAGVLATKMLANGDLAVGGLFTQAGGAPAANFAELTTTCPASRQSAGVGCGSVVLTADLPWIGSTWRATATGLPPVAVAFVVSGVTTTTLPLASVFATAQPGCTLHVQPDVVDLVLATAGKVSSQLAIPDVPTLVGAGFHHQVVSLALDATSAVTATDAVSVVAGSF